MVTQAGRPGNIPTDEKPNEQLRFFAVTAEPVEAASHATLTNCVDSWDLQRYVHPYLRAGAVTDSQIGQALRDGLTAREIHRRLLSAECLLAGGVDTQAYNAGWSDMVDMIRYASTVYGDLLEAAEERLQRFRADCYRESLLTGRPSIEVTGYSHAVGQDEAVTRGLLLLDYLDDEDIAEVLKSMPELSEVKEQAARLHAIASHHARFTMTWTPFGPIAAEELRGLCNG